MSAVGSILTNQGALDALQSINTTSTENNTLENELSTGLAITSPASNPAGFITAQGFTSQLNGLTQAVSNANQGVSLLQTAQGALQQQIGIVQQLNSVAVQAANGTETTQEASSLQGVVSQLVSQVSSIAGQTQFNNVSLLNGTFNNVQFQVGANEGQTLNLSINNTSATGIGLFSTAIKTTTNGGAASGAGSATVSATGEFTAGAVKIVGPTGGSGSTAALLLATSAASAAKDVSAISGKTGVQAQATNTATFAATLGSKGLVFSLQANNGSGGTGSAIGGKVSVNASSLGEAVSQINQQTASTGIAASSASGNLVLTQQNAQNITFVSAGAAGAASGSLTQKGGALVASGNIQQGQVQLQSSAAFTVSGTGSLNVKAPTLSSLSTINVSTTAGANQAINVIKFALQSLNNTGGQLGAVQQGLAANINNLNATSQNATTALGVVQDANLPQVANQLTQAQIQAQAGVAALKSSTTLQQSFLSLLP